MRQPDLRGRTALVTGASSGLGADFADQLAACGAGLILVARRQERLSALAAELRSRYGTEVMLIAADLSDPETPKMLFDTVAGHRPVDILINNAGSGMYGDDLAFDWDDSRRMLQVDIMALAELTKRFAPGMHDRGWGRILQVASLAGHLPSPRYAAYGAAKAFVRQYGEALNAEWRGSGVSCTVLSPGVTATAFFNVAGQRQNLFHKATMMPSARVARIGLHALFRGRRSVVPGILNKLLSFSLRFIPRSLQSVAAAWLMRG